MDTAAPAAPRSVRAPATLPPVLGRPVIVAAALLILAQLAVRCWVAGSGYFYWDDLILVGRAARYPLWSPDLLLYDHDGHFMPLAFVTAWVVTAVAPLVWAGPMVSLLVLQAAASVAAARMLVVLAGARWAVLFPLVFYLFCPLTIPAFAWWAAALNALPLQFALAWVIGDAVSLVRTGRRRYAVSGVVVFAVALLFFEKSVLVPFVAFAVAALTRYVDGRGPVLRPVVRRGAPLWAWSGVVLACWSVLYLVAMSRPSVHNGVGELRESSVTELRDLLPGAASAGIVPALSGGPWAWERWLPSTPWADPPHWAVLTAWFASAVLVALSLHARVRVWPVLPAVVAYVVLAQLPVALVRGGPNTSGELMQSLRYFADVAVVASAAGALLLRARPRGSNRRSSAVLSRAAVPLTGVFLVSSLWSTYTFVNSWRVSPTRTYVANVKSALRNWDGAPLLEQEVPWTVLNPLAYPQNSTIRVIGPLAPPGAFANSTPHLRMITDSGDIVEAAVWWNRRILPGPEPDCGYRVGSAAPVRLPLDGPMLEHEWTVQLNYLADRDGRVAVGFEKGDLVVASVRKGLNTVFVRLIGSGSSLQIISLTKGLDFCVGVGPVGVASYDN